MATVLNRVNEEILQWQEQEKSLVKIFPGDVVQSRESLKGAVEFYKSVIDRYKLSVDESEKRSLTMAKLYVKQLEDKLYPGILRKIIHAIGELINPRAKGEAVEMANFRNQLRLRDQVVAAGFGNISEQFVKQIAENKNEFSIPLEWHLSGPDKISYDLKFQKNSRGQYDFVAYTAAIKIGDDGKEFRKQTFSVSDEFTPTQAYHLLKGRAVEKEFISLDQQLQTVWKQLDFNDRDQAGNYKMKVYPDNFHMDVRSEIHSMYEKGLIAAPAIETIIQGIKNGAEQYALLNVNGKDQVGYFVADPLHERVNILNEKGERVSLLSLVQEGKSSPSLTPDLSKEQDIIISKGIKM